MIGIKCFKLNFLLLICSFIFNSPLNACTRVFSNNNGPLVLVGRNMDWLGDMPVNLVVYPEGIIRNGLVEHPLTWQAKYGSVVAAVYDGQVTTDGMNEQRLAAHILWLAETNYGTRDTHLPGLSVMQWVQFYLDNFKSVNEAVTYTQHAPFQLVAFFDKRTNKWVNVHLALEDKTGDSAIIEYINGKAHIYHNRAYTVVTNSPTYDKQLANASIKTTQPETNLGGSNTPVDRFVRAAFYIQRLNATSDEDEMRGLNSIMQNIAEPFGVPSPERTLVTPTVWGTIADLSNEKYYFHETHRLNMIWVTLNKFNLQAGAPIMKLDTMQHLDLAGDVSARFEESHW